MDLEHTRKAYELSLELKILLREYEDILSYKPDEIRVTITLNGAGVSVLKKTCLDMLILAIEGVKEELRNIGVNVK